MDILHIHNSAPGPGAVAEQEWATAEGRLAATLLSQRREALFLAFASAGMLAARQSGDEHVRNAMSAIPPDVVVNFAKLALLYPGGQ
jgi:hypothetical protein